MATRLTSDDILNLIDRERQNLDKNISEGIPVFAGKGDNKVPLISNGFKIKHKKSGLTYTCLRVSKKRNDIIILVRDDGDGSCFSIPSKNFSKYARV